MLDQVAVTAGIGVNVACGGGEGEKAAGVDAIPEQFQVLVKCATEQQQAELLDRLTAEGLRCTSLIS